jgi:Leucine-rich repeat (LRR) protein
MLIAGPCQALQLSSISPLIRCDKPPTAVSSLETRVDTREMTLVFLGDMFPGIRKLRLNNSVIPSVSDVGCTLVSLSFISLARCNPSPLDGIGTISRSLEELYLAFNELTDVCDLMAMENLTIVDLEDNLISTLDNIETLGLLPHASPRTSPADHISRREADRRPCHAFHRARNSSLFHQSNCLKSARRTKTQS